jgi:hypothetical protein
MAAEYADSRRGLHDQRRWVSTRSRLSLGVHCCCSSPQVAGAAVQAIQIPPLRILPPVEAIQIPPPSIPPPAVSHKKAHSSWGLR